jgi:hypothetical protein
VTQQLSFSLIFLFSFHKLCELMCEYERLLEQKKNWFRLFLLKWHYDKFLTKQRIRVLVTLLWKMIFLHLGLVLIWLLHVKNKGALLNIRIWALRVLSVGAGTWGPWFRSPQAYSIQQTQGTARASWHVWGPFYVNTCRHKPGGEVRCRILTIMCLWISILETSVNMNLVGQKRQSVLECNM